MPLQASATNIWTPPGKVIRFPSQSTGTPVAFITVDASRLASSWSGEAIREYMAIGSGTMNTRKKNANQYRFSAAVPSSSAKIPARPTSSARLPRNGIGKGMEISRPKSASPSRLHPRTTPERIGTVPRRTTWLAK